MQEEPIGITEAICPYCFQMLKKFPGHKTKCPNCGECVFVRTRPTDLLKVVVTNEQAKKIGWQWVRRDFRIRNPDFSWDWAIEKLHQAATKCNWGIYLNTIFQMAQFLEAEENFEKSLNFALYASYIGLNGPNNLSGRDGKGFIKSEGSLSEGILWFIAKSMIRLEIQLSELTGENLDKCSDIPDKPILPLSKHLTWERIKPSLEQVIEQVKIYLRDVAIDWQ